MTKESVPVMGTQGFVADDVLGFTYLIMNFMVTDTAQSNVFSGELFGLSKLMQEFGGVPNKFMIELRNKLGTYLGAYYDNVRVEVSESPNSEENSSKVEILLSITVFGRTSGKQARHDYMLKTAQGQFKELLRINNHGY
jgi:hypothetical protein